MDTCPHKNLYVNVYRSINHKAPKMETMSIKMSIKDGLSIQQNMIRPSKGLQSWCIYYNMGKLRTRRQAQEASHKIHTFNDSSYTTVQNRETDRDSRVLTARGWGAGGYVWAQRGLTANGYRLFHLRWWHVLKWNVVLLAHICKYTQNYWSLYFKWVDLI